MKFGHLTVFLFAAFVLTMSNAFAAGCERSFIGVWQHSGPFGESNTETLTADGQATCSGNGACSNPGSWSCTGNVLHYSNAGGSWDYTLQSDRRTALGPNGTRAVKIQSGAPAPATAHLQEASEEGDTLMARARAADQYCNDTDQDNAGHLYYEAKRAYLRDGNRKGAINAEYYYNNHHKLCDRKVAKKGPPSNGKCSGIEAAIAQMESQGQDAGLQRRLAAEQGCPVQ